MIVTCPKCEARYAVDPLAIGPSGRTVQCARCDNRWFQRVEGPPAPPDLLIRPPTRGGSASLPVPVEARPPPSHVGRTIALTLLVLVVLAGAAGGGAYFYRAKLPLSVSSKLMAARDTAHVYGAALVASVKDLHFFSSDKPAAPPPPTTAAAPTPAASTPPPATTPAATPATTPATTPAPSAAPSSTAAAPSRTEPPATPAQLEVDLSASKIELVDGRYVVHGEIVNHGGTAGAPTKLTVQFKKGNDVLISRSYPLALGPVPPGDRQTFSQVLDNPPPGATDIVPSVE